MTVLMGGWTTVSVVLTVCQPDKCFTSAVPEGVEETEVISFLF